MTVRWSVVAPCALLAVGLLPAAPLAQMPEHGDAAKAGAHVSIRFGSLVPTTVTIVAGEDVEWSNDSVRSHTVTDDGGRYDSGSLAVNSRFRRTFREAGEFSYHCRLHPYIRGVVEVRRLLLDEPPGPGASGRPFPLSGRSDLAAGTELVVEADHGDGWQAVATASTAADGTFGTEVLLRGSARYRVSAGDVVSPPIDVLVLDRTVAAQARKLRRGSRVTARVVPHSPGATVVLQLYLKERFGWWPVARGRLDARSRAAFTIRNRRAVSARVALTLPDGATRLATSEVLRLRR